MKKIILSLIVGIAVVAGFAFAGQKAAQRNEAKLAEASAAIADLQRQISLLAALGADNTEFVGGQLYYLHGSGVSASAASAKLTSFTIPQSGQKLTLAAGRTQYLTIEPGNRTRQEFISCTTLTQNSDDTATFSSCSRGLSPISPYTASTTLQFPHSGGSRVIISNSPAFYNNFTVKNNDETITGIWTYTSTAQPVYDAAPTFTNSLSLITKGYADGLVANGVATSTESQFGGVWLATALQAASSTPTTANIPRVLQAQYATDTPQSGCAVGYTSTAGAGCVPVLTLLGKIRQTMLDIFTTANTWTQAQIFSEAVTHNATTTAASGVKTLGTNLFYTALASTTITGTATPQPVYATTSGALILSDANVNNDSQFLGFAVSSALNGASTTVQIEGIVPGFSGLTRGSRYYVQDAVGTIGTTVGTNEVVVGVAVSTTEVLIQKSDAWGYIGSVAFTNSTGDSTATACVAMATSTSVARKFIAKVDARNGGTPELVYNTFTFTRVGANTPSSGYATNNNAYSSGVSLSISGDVVTLSGSGLTDAATTMTCSGTLYMYR